MIQKYQTPILGEELTNRINDAIAAFNNRGKWKEWGLDKLREQGAAILFHGLPGTGKTITAYYVAKKLHIGIREISMADYGSHEPGELARNIHRIFKGEQILAKQAKKQLPIIFLDECDAMLISRKKLGHDMIWMLEPITALLTEISKYPGLIILSTNLVAMLDDALERRLLAKVLFERPDKKLRYKMWKTKWPDKFPIKPIDIEFEYLANFDLSGAQIETAFLLWAGKLLRQGSPQPTIASLRGFLEFDFPRYIES